MQEDPVTASGPRPGGALREIADDPSSRKRFLKMVGGTGAASALAILLAACGEEDQTTTAGGEDAAAGGSGEASSGGDVGILKYALTLELLEEDLYKQVLDSGELSGEVLELIEEVYENEQEHVLALTSLVEQLGSNPVTAPKTDFKSVLEGGEPEILKVSAMVENLGASAYLGQADKIQTPEILSAALSIHTVEARHAARFNELAGNGFMTGDELRGSVPDGAFAKPMTMEEVLEQIQPFVQA